MNLKSFRPRAVAVLLGLAAILGFSPTVQAQGKDGGADRAQPVLVRRRAVVVNCHVRPVGPRAKAVRKPSIGDEMDHLRIRFAHLVEDPVDDRSAADRQELLGNGIRERPEPRGISGRQDQRLQIRSPRPTTRGTSPAPP